VAKWSAKLVPPRLSLPLVVGSALVIYRQVRHPESKILGPSLGGALGHRTHALGPEPAMPPPSRGDAIVVTMLHAYVCGVQNIRSIVSTVLDPSFTG
jgi:hypothetical protein